MKSKKTTRPPPPSAGSPPFDDELVGQVLDTDEGITFEVKHVGDNRKKIETAVAFANTQGGWLALGVEDTDKAKGRDRVYGIRENPESADELRRLLRSRITPPLDPPPEFHEVGCTLRDGSPGVLPGPVTVENLRRVGSQPRNRILVDHLREFAEPPNTDSGEGIPMMFSEMERANLYPPVFLTTPGAVTATRRQGPRSRYGRSCGERPAGRVPRRGRKPGAARQPVLDSEREVEMVTRIGAIGGRLALAFCAAATGCGGGVGLAGDGGTDRGMDSVVEVDAPPGDETTAPETGEIGEEAADTAFETADDGAAEDGADTTCATVYHWERVPRTIDRVELLEGLSPRFGTTDRLRVWVVLLSACERLAWVETTIEPGGATDFVTITAWAWAPVGLDCPPSAPLVSWIVTLGGREHGNLRVVVTDGHVPGGGLRLEYERELGCSGVPDCACGPGAAPGTGSEGNECLTDCSCAAGLSCLGYFSRSPTWSCLRPCNDSLDCQPFPAVCIESIADGPSQVCGTTPEQCRTDADCPDGFDCWISAGTGGTCHDHRASGSWTSCACDEQCPTHQTCAVPYDVDAVCVSTCLRDDDCPNPEEYHCGSRGVCLWRE